MRSFLSPAMWLPLAMLLSHAMRSSSTTNAVFPHQLQCGFLLHNPQCSLFYRLVAGQTLLSHATRLFTNCNAGFLHTTIFSNRARDKVFARGLVESDLSSVGKPLKGRNGIVCVGRGQNEPTPASA